METDAATFFQGFGMKIFVHGPTGSGKSRLIRALLRQQYTTDHREDVCTHMWTPFNSPEIYCRFLREAREVSSKEKELTLQVWELSGKKVIRSVHNAYLARDSIHILVIDPAISKPAEVSQLLTQIQISVQPMTLFLVLSNAKQSQINGCDTLDFEQTLLNRFQSVKYEQRRHLEEKTEYFRATGNITIQEKVVEKSPKGLPSLQRRVFHLDYSNASVYQFELQEFVKEVILTCLQFLGTYGLGNQYNDAFLESLKKLQEVRNRCSILMLSDDFLETVLPESDRNVQALLIKHHEILGNIIDFRNPSNLPSCYMKQYICVDPVRYAKLLCSIHIDDLKMTLAIDSRRFWPPSSGLSRPERSQLARNIEYIPTRGVVKETLLPLLWQRCSLNESEVLKLIDAMEQQGFLQRTSDDRPADSTLLLAGFDRLSTHHQYLVPVLDLLPDNKPHLNWTPKPFKGDLHISWIYVFHTEIPVGLFQRLVAVCQSQSQGKETYLHQWKYGFLLRLQQIMICVHHYEKRFNISGRINADETERKEMAVQSMWLTLLPFISAASSFLSSWTGIYSEVHIEVSGAEFYQGVEVDTEPQLPLVECLSHWRAGRPMVQTIDAEEIVIDLNFVFPFKAEDLQSTEETSWLNLVWEQRHDINKQLNQQVSPVHEKKRPVANCDNAEKMKTYKRRPNKTIVIKWKLDEEEHEPDEAISDIRSHGEMSSTNKNSQTVNDIRTSVVNRKKPLPNTAGSKRIYRDMAEVAKSVDNGRDSGEDFRLATTFTAAILASAIAQFIEEESGMNPKWKGLISLTQIRAAKIAAKAATETYYGSIYGAAGAVIDAINISQRQETTQSNHYMKSQTCKLL